MFSSLCSVVLSSNASDYHLKRQSTVTKIYTNSIIWAREEFGYTIDTSSFAEANRGKATAGTKVSSRPREKSLSHKEQSPKAAAVTAITKDAFHTFWVCNGSIILYLVSSGLAPLLEWLQQKEETTIRLF